MFQAVRSLKLSSQILKNYSRFPTVFFSTSNMDESDDDFKPKSKVKDENPEEVIKFIDKVSCIVRSLPFLDST